MKKAKFVKDGYVDGELVFKAGCVYEISDDLGSYSRWVRRGIAEEYIEQPIESSPKKSETSHESKHKSKSAGQKKFPKAHSEDIDL